MGTFKERRIGIIDIGSNSMLYLLGHRNVEGKITIERLLSAVTGLGHGVAQTGTIDGDRLNQALKIYASYVEDAKEHGADEIHAMATSASRETSNRQDVEERFSSVDAEVQFEIIEPNVEGSLTYKSVTADCGHEDPSMAFDIGGGSTEVTWGLGPRFDGCRSLNLGTVKLLDGVLGKKERFSPQDIEAAKAHVDGILKRIPPLGSLKHAYGTAGSFTQTMSVLLELETYAPDKVDMQSMNQGSIRSLLDRLAPMSVDDICQLPGADNARAHVMVAGLLIIDRLMNKFKAPEIFVRDRGLRYGKLFEVLRKFQPPVVLDLKN